jgi:N-hydroxyarylamine O-acetyltransferase
LAAAFGSIWRAFTPSSSSPGAGGYCYEHSGLLRAALEQLGLAPVAHSARVVMVTPRSAAPRSHMFLTVPLAGETLVLDPGFGGHGPLVPVPLVEDHEVRDGADVHRMTRRHGEWVLEAKIAGAMTPLWMSTLEAESPIDFVMATSHRPGPIRRS